MTAVFFILFSWCVMTAKKRKQVVALAAAGVVVVMVVSPRPVFAQSLWGAIQAVLNVINGIIQTALNAINSVRSAISQFYQLSVWPQQLISQAQSLVTQMINRYRSLMAGIFNTNLSSATLPATQGLESVIRNSQTSDFSLLSLNYTSVYGTLPSATAASSTDRTLIDMDDSLAQGTLKTLKESDDAVNLTLSIADQMENAASQAAPGSAPFLTASAVTASIRSQALTQKMLAANLRQEAAHLAHRNALRKRGATFASQVSTSIQNTLQPQ
jgi:Arc/MetJ family transcription regulator